MTNWDKILVDFAHKCGDGGPDMTNPRHLALLRESLIKFGWKEIAANELLGNLREAKKGGGPVPAGFTKSKTPKAKYYFINPQPKAGKSPIHDLTDETGKKRKWKYATKDEVEYSKSLSGLVTQKGKSKEKERPAQPKGGDPVRATDGIAKQKAQVKANAEAAREAVVKKKKALETLEATEPKDETKIAKAKKALKTAEKKKEAAEYTETQFEDIVKAIKSGNADKIESLIDESLKRVREAGFAQPGGIAASNGESSCCNAANKLSENYDQNKIGSDQDHNGETIKPDEQQAAFDNETPGRRIEHAIELGLVELCEKGTDGCPDGYKPDPMDKKTQKSIGLELEKRRKFVEAEQEEILKGKSEIAEDIRAAQQKVEVECGKDPDGKACKTATNGLKTKENNLKEWLETGYDTGRAMLDDIVHDRDENGEPGDYNAPEKFPNDDENIKHGTPKSAIMSPEMQALFRGQLEKKRKDSKGRYISCTKTAEDKRKEKGFAGAPYDCKKEESVVEHYDDQLKNFDEGVSDHDTGMIYYDKNGNLRFVNVSNKKTKDTGKGESKKGAGDEDRNEVAGGIDPQHNSTPAAREEAVMSAIDKKIEEEQELPEEKREFPGFDGSLGRKVGSRLIKGYKKAFALATDASTNVTTLQVRHGETAEMTGVSKNDEGVNQPTSDATVMGNLSENLPPKKQKGVYYKKLAARQEVKDKIKELFPEEPKGGYTRDHVIAAAIELMKDPSQDLPYDPFGKIIEKYGEVYNDMEDKFNNKGWTLQEIAEKYPPLTASQVEQLLDPDKNNAMRECGALKTRRQNSMTEAHREIVKATKKQDQAWFNEPEGKGREWAEANGWKEDPPDSGKWVEKTPGSGKNGPYTQTYVREYMNNMHWDKYIANLDGKKQLQIGGVNCKPKDLRKCLAELSGYDEPEPKLSSPPEEGEKEKIENWRKKLLEHLEEKVDIDADTGAVRVKGKDGASLGYDTWRTAGTAPKTAAGPGKDLRKCLRKKNNTRQVNRRKKK